MTGPWIDLHAHPGQFFARDLPDGHPALALRGLGADVSDPADIAPAGMTVVSFATVSDAVSLTADPTRGLAPGRTADDAELYADHLRQLNAAHATLADIGAGVLTCASDIAAAGRQGIPLALLACEGAEFVGEDYRRLRAAYERGVRSVQLVHYCASPYGDVQTLPATHGGLSAAGREVVREMNRLGMLVDLAHASMQTTREAAELSATPIMVSHTHLNGTARDHPRMISDEHARIVARCGGVIGAWPSGFSSQTFDDFVGEIERLIEVVGTEHVAIGTDMDGNFRPVLTRYGQFADLAAALTARGVSSDEADAILGGNAARVLSAACG